jgi:hypothetical protein
MRNFFLSYYIQGSLSIFYVAVAIVKKIEILVGFPTYNKILRNNIRMGLFDFFSGTKKNTASKQLSNEQIHQQSLQAAQQATGLRGRQARTSNIFAPTLKGLPNQNRNKITIQKSKFNQVYNEKKAELKGLNETMAAAVTKLGSESEVKSTLQEFVNKLKSKIAVAKGSQSGGADSISIEIPIKLANFLIAILEAILKVIAVLFVMGLMILSLGGVGEEASVDLTGQWLPTFSEPSNKKSNGVQNWGQGGKRRTTLRKRRN